MASYVRPKDVTAPAASLSIVRVVHDGGAGGQSLALILWEGVPRVALRWNGKPGRPNGVPFSRKPVWFIPDRNMHAMLIGYIGEIAAAHVSFARDFLGVPA